MWNLVFVPVMRIMLPLKRRKKGVKIWAAIFINHVYITHMLYFYFFPFWINIVVWGLSFPHSLELFATPAAFGHIFMPNFMKWNFNFSEFFFVPFFSLLTSPVSTLPAGSTRVRFYLVSPGHPSCTRQLPFPGLNQAFGVAVCAGRNVIWSEKTAPPSYIMTLPSYVIWPAQTQIHFCLLNQMNNCSLRQKVGHTRQF